MASNAFRVLAIRFESSQDESIFIFELGTKTVRHKIPAGEGFIRASVVLDTKNEITAVEVVTEKT